MATKQVVVSKPKRGMSRARRAQLSKVMKAKWEAKRQANVDAVKQRIKDAIVAQTPLPAPFNPSQELLKAKLAALQAMAQLLVSAAHLADNLHGI